MPPPYQPTPGAPPETAELTPPSTVWLQDRLYFTSPAKLLLKRVPVTLTGPDTRLSEGTIGIALGISGIGAHLRFWGEGGLHTIKSAELREGPRPEVCVKVSGEPLASYRPPEVVVRRGWFRDERLRRQYDLTKGEIFDSALDESYVNPRFGLPAWLAHALTANVRAKLLKLIVE